MTGIPDDGFYWIRRRNPTPITGNPWRVAELHTGTWYFLATLTMMEHLPDPEDDEEGFEALYEVGPRIEPPKEGDPSCPAL